MKCIQCCDCKNYRDPSEWEYGAYCEAIRYKGVVPYQCTTFPSQIGLAWNKCKGKRFEAKKSFFQRLFG